MSPEVPQVARQGDLTRRGNAALDLVDRVAEAVSSRQGQLQAGLTKIVDQLKSTESRNRALTERASQAEKHAEEAEKWLRRLHAKLEEEFCFDEAPSSTGIALDQPHLRAVRYA